MAGAGLRLSELNAGEGERGLLLHETLGPDASLQKIICGATRRRTIEKYPWSVLLCGTLAEACDPAADANTVCSPMPTDSRRLRWFL